MFLVEPVLFGVLVVLEEDLNLVVHLVLNVLAEDAGYFFVRLGRVLLCFVGFLEEDIPMIPMTPNDRDDRQVVRRPTT